jgi:HEAT repeat protein
MNRVARALAVRPGEGRLVALLALAFAAAEAGRGLGEVAVTTLGLDAVGPTILPPLYIGLGTVGLVATLGYGAIVARATGDRVVPAVLLVIAAILTVEGFATVSGSVGVYAVAWVSVFTAGALLTTILWTVAGATFHARQARRLFSLCTSAAIGGGFVGLLSAGPLAALIGPSSIIVGYGLLLVVSAVALVRLRPRLRPVTDAHGTRMGALGALRAGASDVARSPLMRLVAVAYVLFAILLNAMQYPFSGAMTAAFPGRAELATALGLFAAAVTAVSFLMASLVANRLYARLGVVTVALLLPLAYLLGFGVWFVAFGIGTAIGVKFTQEVTQRGLSNTAWNAFFSVVPASRRGQVRAFIDGVPGQVGTVIAGVFLVIASAFSNDQLFAVGVIASLACLVVVWMIRRRYAASLVATLRGGLAEQVLEGGPGLVALTRSPGVVTDLRAALKAERPGERRLAVELLGRIATRDVADDLLPMLADPDRGVRLATLDALAVTADEEALPGIASVIDDPDPEVRVRAVRTATALDGRSGAPWLDDAVSGRLKIDADPRVRAELAVAWCGTARHDAGRLLLEDLVAADDRATQVAGLGGVARLGGAAPIVSIKPLLSAADATVRAAAVEALGALDATPAIDDQLIAALADPAPSVGLAAARGLRARSPVPEGVLRTLVEGSEMAQDAALEAIDSEDVETHDRLITWSVGQVRRATYLRRQVVLLEAAVDAEVVGDDHAVASASTAYLAFLLRRRSLGIEARLLRALAILGAPEASGLIRRSLRADDVETRAQAIEALDALGDGRLSRAVVRLLDSEPEVADGPAPDVINVARGLIDDRDAWVRALAIRTLGAHLAVEGRAVTATALGDVDPIVRMSLRGVLPVELPVPETRATLDELERMLFLRGVPLFMTLAPEDLQRLAATTVERAYAAGEALVREGDLGDELIVIVEGSVQVVRDIDGERRLIRRYQKGDHIGELAVLREGRRTATVVADPPGVRGLVLGGEAVKAILRERPEAAMAMLGTLADRISATT